MTVDWADMPATAEGAVIYACLFSGDLELEVGPVASWGEALVVEEVMRERLAELVMAADLIHEVDGNFVREEGWAALHDEALVAGRAHHWRRSSSPWRRRGSPAASVVASVTTRCHV